MEQFLKINEADNVAVAIGGDTKIGHKFALRPIKKGEEVVKYGYPIGRATADISEGEWVHTHNLATSLGDNLEYTYNPTPAPSQNDVPPSPTVNGYLRRTGEMGIRNELWILPTVGCVNGSAQAIARRLNEEFAGAENIDDIIAFTHNYGCSQLGDDHTNTRRALAALARHPNAGGVIVLGLGCENNRVSELREEIGSCDPERVTFITAQEVSDEIETGVEAGRRLIEVMKSDRRQPLPASMLKIGLKCGGSDGLSGITANPLVGLLSDRIVAWGGTTVLTEVPEMFGAETILMARAADKSVFDKEVKLINDFKDYFRQSGQPIYENPSPGNKEGGITTLEEKSLGCIQKGGRSTVIDVISYAQHLTASGLNLLQAPGNDLVASTALALSGCQMVLFTTGRGTPFGTAVPTLKISTNTPLAERKPTWIDYDTGGLVNGQTFDEALVKGQTFDEALVGLTDLVIETANGRLTKQERNRYKEIAIFKTGVTL